MGGIGGHQDSWPPLDSPYLMVHISLPGHHGPTNNNLHPTSQQAHGLALFSVFGVLLKYAQYPPPG